MLCDQHMPACLGAELFAALRGRLGDAAPMLVLMSGDDHVIAPAADEILLKPFGTADLHALVERVSARCRDVRPVRGACSK